MASVVVMPKDSPVSKMEATRSYQKMGNNPNSEVVLCDRSERELVAQRYVDKGMTLIPPYNHPLVMAGQGTAVLELINEVGHLDYLFVCVGGGGLLRFVCLFVSRFAMWWWCSVSGSAVAAKHLLPNIKVVGVEPEAGNDAQLSFRTGSIVHIDVPATIADGAQTQHMGGALCCCVLHWIFFDARTDLTFTVMKALVDDMRTVSDAQLVDMMKLFFNRMKIVVEPTGVRGLCALLSLITVLQAVLLQHLWSLANPAMS
jgi:threonine dehydratase